MAVIVDGSEILLSGTVGDLWFEDGFTNTQVILALAQVGAEKDVTIRLNSGGGIATEGSAIHATLARHKGRKTVIIEGIAASAASVLAMAGDEVVMSLGATMMVHDPANFTWGTADDHRRTIAELDAIGDATGSIYAAKTGRPLAEIRAEMKAELWMTAEQAVEKGFADKADRPANDNDATQSAEVSPFDYRRYAHAPQQLRQLATQMNWTLPEAARRPATPAPARQQQETTMPTDKERAEAAERRVAELEAQSAKQSAGDDAKELADLRKERDDRQRFDAIMSLDEAKGREDVAKALASAGNTVDSAKAVLAATPKKDESDDGAANPQAYERARMSGAGLGQGGGGAPKKKGDLTTLNAAVERTNKRVGSRRG